MQPEEGSRTDVTVIGPSTNVIRHQGMAWLAANSGERRYVQSELRIGRAEQNDLRITDGSVSRFHAFLRRVDGRYLLSDVGSQNGTFVNGTRVHAPSALRSGDRIRMGTTEFTFYLDEVAEEPASHEDSRTTQSGAHPYYVQGELRIVSVLFLDLNGFTAMSEGMAPDEVTDLMNRCFERLTSTVSRFGGYVDKYVGDAMMVLFGAPVAHDDDPERAVRAALALQDELARFNERILQRANVKLQMRVGINTGEVLAGRVGAGEFGQYTVMGDPVNLASRLEHSARVGHVLVGAATYRLTRSVIRYVALAPMSIRGKTDPVQAYEVVGLQDPTSSAAVTMDSSFVGRDRELTLLSGLIESSRGGLQTATVVGPAGSGKSALLTELYRRYASEARWALVRCTEYDQQTPYFALRKLITEILRPADTSPEATSRSLAGSAGAQLAALVQLLSPNVEPSVTGAPEAGRLVLTGAFTQLIAQYAVRESLVLLIDADQWIDLESRAVLEAALPDLEDTRLVAITTARPGEGHAWLAPMHTVRLERFSRKECAQMVSVLLRGDPVATDTIDVLARESGGNPLLLAEMVRSGTETGALTKSGDEWHLVQRDALAAGGNVDSLRGIVQARLDQLSAGERRLLQVAAVCGDTCTASLLARVLEDNLPIPDLLRELADREYLVEQMGDEEPSYSFAHGITQEVAYASLPHTHRERLHESVGRVLEGQFDAAYPNKALLRQLIYHFIRGSSRDRAALYLMHAADAAAGFAEDDWAIATYRRALDFAQRAKDRQSGRRLALQIQERLGEALLRQSRLTDAQVAFEAACELDDTPASRARLRAQLALVATRQGNYQRALELTRSGLEDSDDDPRLRGPLEGRMALSLCALGQLAEAEEHAARARAYTRSAAGGASFHLAQAASGAVLRLRGNLMEAQTVLDEGLATQLRGPSNEELNTLRMELALTCYTLGDTTAAVSAVESCLRSSASTSDEELPLPVVDETGNIDEQRRWDPRDSWIFASAELLLGRMLLERGNLERATKYFDDALVRGERIGARAVTLVARMRQAHAALALGRGPEAVNTARAAVAAASALKLRPLVSEIQAVLAAALLRVGELTEAAEVAREGVVGARTLHLPIHEAVCRRLLGVALGRAGQRVQAL
ncbi:MAG TPA: adenylate/guanylate cyclase domain-containing protein, partial [Chloroflexota bacterium]|nr:adenylate/guanylate cyclase domain-containing protein [Chloroflexota bacterium]